HAASPSPSATTHARTARRRRLTCPSRSLTAAQVYPAPPKICPDASAPGDCRSAAPVTILLEDRSQPPHRLCRLAPGPRAATEGIHQPIGKHHRNGLERVLDLCRAARAGRQRVGAEHPDPVVLPAPSPRDDPKRRLELCERYVGPGEAPQRCLH